MIIRTLRNDGSVRAAAAVILTVTTTTTLLSSSLSSEKTTTTNNNINTNHQQLNCCHCETKWTTKKNSEPSLLLSKKKNDTYWIQRLSGTQVDYAGGKVMTANQKGTKQCLLGNVEVWKDVDWQDSKLRSGRGYVQFSYISNNDNDNDECDDNAKNKNKTRSNKYNKKQMEMYIGYNLFVDKNGIKMGR